MNPITTEQTDNIKPLLLLPDGTLYLDETPEDLLFYQGWQPTSVTESKDIEESRRVASRIHAIQKQCWFNSRRAVLQLPEYGKASYIEGWALLDNGLPIEHGWIILGDKVIDPTLSDTITTYFPGLEFRGRVGIHEFLMTPKGKKCRKSPFFFAFGWGGMKSPSFRKCYEAAATTLKRMNHSADSAKTNAN